MADFSNVGEIVDITAPGVGIRSVRMGGGYTEMDGTSMATPHVAAACALLKTFNPDMGAFEVINTLKGAAIDVGIEGGGTGILNVTDLLKIDNVINGEGSFLHFTSLECGCKLRIQRQCGREQQHFRPQRKSNPRFISAHQL